MDAVGIIVEYNPFHNGHAYHIRKAKEISNADIVIAVMSGPFLQRGEPALVSKWARTEMALRNGVDIVFELPYPFATQKAETFANGAISILNGALCKSLCFGSESGSIENFYNTFNFINNNNQWYQDRIKYYISKGLSYPRALSEAFQELSPSDNMIDLSKPNNILGFHYVEAIKKQNAPIHLFTIKRKVADYHDEFFSSDTIASATSIRKNIFSNDLNLSSISSYVSTSTLKILKSYKDHYSYYHQWESYWPYLQYRLIHSNSNELRNIYEIEEGIENRLLSAVLKANSFHQFMELIKTKRYTWTRLQRICLHILTNTTKDEMSKISDRAEYLRLLGMTNKGRSYLNANKSQLKLPLVSKLSTFSNSSISLDIRASRIYALGLGRNSEALIKQEYSQPPIFLSNK